MIGLSYLNSNICILMFSNRCYKFTKIKKFGLDVAKEEHKNHEFFSNRVFPFLIFFFATHNNLAVLFTPETLFTAQSGNSMQTLHVSLIEHSCYSIFGSQLFIGCYWTRIAHLLGSYVDESEIRRTLTSHALTTITELLDLHPPKSLTRVTGLAPAN